MPRALLTLLNAVDLAAYTAAGYWGGETLYAFGPTVDNLQVRNNETFGVLKVTLRPGAYDWQFMPVAGKTFTDSGSGNCHGRPT